MYSLNIYLYKIIILLRYSLNVIGSVVFGLNVDTISNPHDSFRTMEKLIHSPSLLNIIKGACVFLCPK